MKSKYFLVCFIALLITSFASTVYAAEDAEYDMQVKEGDRFIYFLSIWNDDLAHDHLGSSDPEDELGSGAAEGRKFSYEVDDIDSVNNAWSWERLDYVGAWMIELDYWGWTDDEVDFEEENDGNEILTMFENASDFGEYCDFLFQSFVIPTPVSDYLGDCDWDNDYNKNESRVTYGNGTVFETREWQGNGVLRSITVRNSDDEIIYEILIDKSREFWIIPITIGIVGAILVAIVIAARKKASRENLL